jgi:hypothetical protein
MCLCVCVQTNSLQTFFFFLNFMSESFECISESWGKQFHEHLFIYTRYDAIQERIKLCQRRLCAIVREWRGSLHHHQKVSTVYHQQTVVASLAIREISLKTELFLPSAQGITYPLRDISDSLWIVWSSLFALCYLAEFVPYKPNIWVSLLVTRAAPQRQVMVLRIDLHCLNAAPSAPQPFPPPWTRF